MIRVRVSGGSDVAARVGDVPQMTTVVLHIESDESGSMPKEIITLVDSTLMFKGESNNNMDARLEKSYWVSKISNKVEKDRCQYDKKII
ncbi:hypothetical protein MTR_2g076470 [Medicago truncatula]|uniref:Uncharacterized protein n=1 Tax=Medicago truncatula TaxID=3880 RepID=G7IH55_MEDTR|nr:hypothetical protein MTR_2g076470 [Medicago truncatula]